MTTWKLVLSHPLISETPVMSGAITLFKLISAENRHYLIKYLLIIFVLIMCANNLHTILTMNPNHYSFVGRLTVDSASFVKIAKKMISKNNWLKVETPWRSVGAQSYYSIMMRVFSKKPLNLKICQFFLWGICLFLIYRIFFSQTGSQNVSLLGTGLFSASNLLQKYCAILQYELVTLLLILLIFYILTNHRLTHITAFLITFLTIILCIFYEYFVIFIPAFIIYFIIKGVEKKFLKIWLTVFSIAGIFALVLNIYVLLTTPYYKTFRKKTLTMSSMDKDSKGVYAELFVLKKYYDHVVYIPRRWMVPGSKGYNFPFPDIEAKRSAYKNIETEFSYPLFFINKMQYLFGIKRDIWYIDPLPVNALTSVFPLKNCYNWKGHPKPPQVCESHYMQGNQITAFISGFVYFVFFIFGLIYIGRNRTPLNILAILLFIACFIPQFFVGSSTRFLIPMYGLILFIQFIPWTKRLNALLEPQSS